MDTSTRDIILHKFVTCHGLMNGMEAICDYIKNFSSETFCQLNCITRNVHINLGMGKSILEYQSNRKFNVIRRHD